MARLGYSDPECVSSFTVDSVEAGIRIADEIMDNDKSVTSVWVRDDNFDVVWRKVR